ncbi:transporter [Vibrio hippocampi]|uniref:Transporter n=1 Tax=Vibrio hippocampi TaxID=654686 RepID=A0ABM8ZGR0_9VIBR|nr:transporter [Vibrio hippocampi]CAH0525817.1 hypothetical protein VHP8226_01348 [Vibrio hippocampi]
MCNKDSVEVEFDYTSFLGASCSKKWTFLELFSAIAPSFGFKSNQYNEDTLNTHDRLFDQAFTSLACGHSDEENLVELMKLARQYQVNALKIAMPYALEQGQIASIEQRALVNISPMVGNDDLVVSILPMM